MATLSIQEQIDLIDKERNVKSTLTSQIKADIKEMFRIRMEIHTKFIEESRIEFSELYNQCNQLFEYIISLATSKKDEIFPDNYNSSNNEPTHFSDYNVASTNYKKLKKYYNDNCHTDIDIDQHTRRLFDFKKAHEKKLEEIAKKQLPHTSEKYPRLINLAITYDINKLDEFNDILDYIIKNISNVQDGKITQQECTHNVLQKDLVDRFYKTF